ncbi:hypothetical protein LIER_19933 [Lithospermum erythrorhizon]|uniref:RING-type domain-containing protein n=1 Tax=Lithospermum erythrorhizon TaxID=34254 RepID=A0AAV3QL35_LITER
MTFISRKLLLTSNITAASHPPPLAAAPPPLEADFVVVLAALLCAIVCILALIVVARCAWLRRGTSGWSFRRSDDHLANKRLKKKVFKSLPKYIHKSGGGSAVEVEVEEVAEDCAICLSEYVDGEEIRVLPQCGHRFHVGCIDMWLGSHSSCPSCRQILGSPAGADGDSGDGDFTSGKIRPVSSDVSASSSPSPPPFLP